MKKIAKYGIIIIVAIITLIATLTLIIISRPWIAGDVASDIGETLQGVMLSIEEGSLTREGATFVVHNESDYRIALFCWSSLNMRLQVLRGEEWRYINSAFQSAAGCVYSYDIAPSESVAVELSWSGIYGRLHNGRYRFVNSIFISDESLILQEESRFSVVYEFNINNRLPTSCNMKIWQLSKLGKMIQ